MSVPFRFFVDFSNNGGYAETGEEVTAHVDGTTGVIMSRGKDQIRQLAPPAAGQFNAMLDNSSRDYSPGNMSSPLYGLISPGRAVRVIGTAIGGGTGVGGMFLFEDGTQFQFEDGTDFEFEDAKPVSGGTGRNVWTGVLDDIPQHPAVPQRVEIPSLGTLSRLRGKFVSTALYQNITTDVALSYLLDAVGWPAAERIIDTGLATLDWWWLNEQDAFDAMVEIVTTEGPAATIYENGDGFIVFENRDARATQTRSTVSQATYSTAIDIQAFEYNPNFRDVIKAATVSVQEREPGALDVIWTYGSTLVLANNEVKILHIRTSDPFLGATVPSPVGINEAQTLTADAVLTVGTFTLSFGGQTTAALNYNATAAQIQTELEGLSTIGAGNVLCTGGPINTTPVRVVFWGTLKEQDVELLTVTSGLNTTSKPATINIETTDSTPTTITFLLHPSSPLASGNFQLRTGSTNTTTNIAYNATAATIQSRLEATTAIVPGDVTVSGGPINTTDVTVEFLLSSSWTLHVVNSTLITNSDPTATLVVTEAIKGGGPDYVLTAGSVSFTIDRDSGASLMLTATAGSSGATLTGLQLRAQAVPVVRTQLAMYPMGTAVPEGQIFKPNVKPEIPLVDAQAYAQALVEYNNVPRPTSRFMMRRSQYDPALDDIFAREISDMITIVDFQTGLSNTFHIENISHVLTGRIIDTTFGCEKVMVP